MPRRISMIELRDLLLQLRKGESIKSIHRSSGRHKTIIRALKELAEHEGWLATTTSVPTEAEIQAVWNTRLVNPETASGKMFLISHGKEILIDDGKEILMFRGKQFFTSYGKQFFM